MPPFIQDGLAGTCRNAWRNRVTTVEITPLSLRYLRCMRAATYGLKRDRGRSNHTRGVLKLQLLRDIVTSGFADGFVPVLKG